MQRCPFHLLSALAMMPVSDCSGSSYRYQHCKMPRAYHFQNNTLVTSDAIEHHQSNCLRAEPRSNHGTRDSFNGIYTDTVGKPRNFNFRLFREDAPFTVLGTHYKPTPFVPFICKTVRGSYVSVMYGGFNFDCSICFGGGHFV